MKAVIIGDGPSVRLYYAVVLESMSLGTTVTKASGDMRPSIYLRYPAENLPAVLRICKECEALNQPPNVYYEQQPSGLWGVVVLFRLNPISPELAREIIDPQILPQSPDTTLIMTGECYDFEDEDTQRFLGLYRHTGDYNLLLLDPKEDVVWGVGQKSLKRGMPSQGRDF